MFFFSLPLGFGRTLITEGKDRNESTESLMDRNFYNYILEIYLLKRGLTDHGLVQFGSAASLSGCCSNQNCRRLIKSCSLGSSL